MLIEILIIVTCNYGSKRSLTNPISIKQRGDDQNHFEEQRRKRNQKAVAILTTISVVYVICTLPASLYNILLGVSLMYYNKNEELFNLVSDYKFFGFMYVPALMCSGFNALVYMLKDKKIKKYYYRQFCCKKRKSRPEERANHSTVPSKSVVNASLNLD